MSADAPTSAQAALPVGSRCGDYDIIELIGSGAMGEVYRARERSLGRDVALKLLPERFRVDPQRLARFAREAQVLGALNHPNIATLHGVVSVAHSQALALELVDGLTLAERMADGPMKLPEAIDIARQIGAGLATAHEHGIVHRDLKPANIKLRTDGVVKLLDFGLAKVLDPNFCESDPQLATITSVDAGSHALGTPAYMSPEQARGYAVDARSDIWAFGCVLFEMLTGRRAFGGATISDTVAAVLEHEPEWSALPPECPDLVRRMLRRCLAKDLRDRLQHIGDASIDLRDALQEGRPPAGFWRARNGWLNGRAAIGLLAATLAGGLLVMQLGTTRQSPVAVTRLEIVTTRDLPFVNGTTRDIAISPDGSRIAYRSANSSLAIRSLDRFESAMLTDLGPEVSSPTFSPDGSHIAFLAGAALKSVPVTGGKPSFLADVGEYTDRSLIWTPDDSIIIASTRGILRVPAGGGEPEVIVSPDAANGEKAFGSPALLPGGEWLLHMIQPLRTETGTRIVALNLKSRERRELLRGGSDPHYLPTGHLVYMVDNALLAVRFDTGRLAVRSAPAIVATDVMVNANGIASLCFAANGTLVYVSGKSVATLPRLAWVTRDGREQLLSAPPMAYTYPRLSPDGQSVAVDVRGAESDIWLWDLRRERLTRVTVNPAENPLPVWSPGGNELAFGDGSSGTVNVYRQALNGGPMERLSESTRRQIALSYTPDGRNLFVGESQPTGGWDVLLLNLARPQRLVPLLHAPASEMNVVPSPDGRWIAYSSDESGRVEIYVRPFPAVQRELHRVSRGGGSKPLWSSDGREIFFLSPSREIMSAQVDAGAGFVVRGVSRLFDAVAYTSAENGTGARPFDISSDGKRFLMVRKGEAPGAARIAVVLNWFEEVRRLAQ